MGTFLLPSPPSSSLLTRVELPFDAFGRESLGRSGDGAFASATAARQGRTAEQKGLGRADLAKEEVQSPFR